MKAATTVRYLKRFNLGNYEHEECDVTISLPDSVNLADGIKAVKAQVILAITNKLEGNIAPLTGVSHGQESSEESNEKINQENSKSEEPKQQKKGKGSKSSAVKEEAKEEYEEVASPFTAHAEVKEEKKAAPKSKNVIYNRNEERHVAVLTSFLTQINGGESWKTNPKITQFSISLVGKEFMTPDGSIVEEFSAACYDFFGVKKSGL